MQHVIDGPDELVEGEGGDGNGVRAHPCAADAGAQKNWSPKKGTTVVGHCAQQAPAAGKQGKGWMGALLWPRNKKRTTSSSSSSSSSSSRREHVKKASTSHPAFSPAAVVPAPRDESASAENKHRVWVWASQTRVRHEAAKRLLSQPQGPLGSRFCRQQGGDGSWTESQNPGSGRAQCTAEG